MDVPAAAAAQLFCFRTSQALAAGWSRRQLDAAAASGSLTRVCRSIWIESARLAVMTQAQRHAVAVRAEQLVLGPRWFAGRRSAALLCGLPLIGKAPSVPQLLAEPLRPGERSNSRHRHLAALPTEQRAQVNGVPCTAVQRTAMDIARHEPYRNAMVVADAVLGLGVDRGWLFRTLAAMERWPGVEQARRVAGFADGLAESPLESISRVAIHELGLPAPELQVEVYLGARLLGRVDTLWRQFNTVGEADGVQKYGEDEATRRARFRQEKVREEWFADVGLEVARWTWDEAWRPRGVLDARLERAFTRGRRQPLDPRVRFVPTTVAERLRRAA